MNEKIVNFKITSVAAQVDERVRFEWQGKKFDSGPLTVELDENAPAGANQGLLNYSERRARADFHLRLRFPQLADTLEGIGGDPELIRPVSVSLHAEDAIINDHSYTISCVRYLASH